MLRDVTFGQYYNADSFVHRMDSRAKILLSILYMVGVFFVKSYVGFAWLTAFLLIAIGASQVPLKSILKSLRGILFLLLFSAVLNVFFVKQGNLLVKWWIFEIYDQGLIDAGKLMLRLGLLVCGASLLTLTTTPVDLTHAIEKLLKPLSWIGVPVHIAALIMSLTLSFIPSIIEETDRIIRAQKARGADFDTGGLIKRAKAFVPILIPLIISSIRRAEELAFAMNSRCYEGSKKHTQMKVMKFTWRDLVGTVVTCLFFGAIFTLFALDGNVWLNDNLPWLFF